MKTRKKRPPADKVREAVMGNFYIREIEQKECGECGERRNSVDDSGLCGYCRAVLIVRK